MRLKSLIANEQQEHIAFIERVNLELPKYAKYLLHPANGGSRHPAEARNLKRMGVRPGVSDIFFAYPVNGYHGLWMELKRKNGKLTSAQAEWLQLMQEVDYAVAVAFSSEQAMHYILSYIKGNL